LCCAACVVFRSSAFRIASNPWLASSFMTERSSPISTNFLLFRYRSIGDERHDLLQETSPAGEAYADDAGLVYKTAFQSPFTFTQQTAALTEASGVHDIYIVFKGGPGVGNFDWMKFSN
jgi:hypothetical protein